VDDRRERTFYTLGIFCALIYIGNYVAHVASRFSYPLLLLASAWMVAFVLTPVARWLDQGVFPDSLTDWVRRRWGDQPADLLSAFRIPYGLAVILMYFSMLFGLALLILLVSPPLITQLTRLSQQLPEYVEQLPDWWAGVQDKIVERFGVEPEALADIISVDDLAERATAALPDILEEGIGLLQGIASGVANTLLVLTFSLYLMLDSQHLSEQLDRILPQRYHDDLDFLNHTIKHAFGSFLLGKVVKGGLHAAFVMIVMSLFDVPYRMVTATFTGLLMFIPQLGMPVAMVAPSVMALIQGSGSEILLLIVMVVFQQVLIRFIMPKLTSEWTGMPPLLSMVSVLVGTIVLGVWGFFFSAPAATAIYLVAVTVLERKKQAADVRDRERSRLLTAFGKRESFSERA
jgi:predicted PurR-regulated permease PerM